MHIAAEGRYRKAPIAGDFARHAAMRRRPEARAQRNGAIRA